MCKKILTAVFLSAAVALTGCTAQKTEDTVELSQQEKEIAAVAEWFSESMTDGEDFPDIKDYQYYARAVGLDKDALLTADMWEVFYNEEININREIDGKAIYLIRLDTYKLLEIYAANNNSTVERVCESLSLTSEQLYYNWGYTAASVNYTKNHKDGKAAYSEKEQKIFGIDNGEDRQSVMSTHFLTVDIANGNTVTYSNTISELEIKQRDNLRCTTKMTYNYTEYTEDEKNPAFTVNGIGIRRVLPLTVPNGWREAADTDITVMFNASPFSYGCTDRDNRSMNTYYLEDSINTIPETKYIDFSEFYDSGSADSESTIEIGYVTSDNERRRVTETNTVGFYSQKLNADGTAEGKPIYMEWAKAANWNFQDGICSSSLDNNRLVMSFRIIEKNIPKINVSERETDGGEIHSPMGNTEEERHISAADISIGDRFLYKGEEVTVSSFNGIYPDDIGISKIEKSGSIEYEVTRNVDKFALANDGIYLGNPENDRSAEKAEYTDEPITSRDNFPVGNYAPHINDIIENDDGVYKIADLTEKYVTLLETDTLIPNTTIIPITDFYKSDFVLLERGEAIPEESTEKAVEIVEKPVSNSENYVISDDKFGDMGGAKSRYTDNIEAIKTLKSIEADGRNATPAEQDILANYTGWGAIPQAFDGTNTKWSSEYAELKELLTPEEYEAARHSTMNAHYTSPTVISAMYDVLNNLGFEKGNILEPAMGTGNFFGMLPKTYRDNNLYGVELDSITGRIAQQLYPNADIQIKGYEKTSFPDNSFDVAVGNVPFGDYGISDKRYNEYNFNIHDYFFAKTLDKVHAGGIIAFVTSKGTMDKENDGIRRYIAQRAELLGAIRLPNNAFKATAGTEVTSDILILQKRERPIDINPDSVEWIKKSETADGLSVNNYFVQHPEMVLGKITEGNKLYGNSTKDTSCTPIEGADLKQQLAEAIENIKGTYRSAEIKVEPKNEDVIPAPANSRKFSFYELDGNIYYREAGDTMKKVNVSKDVFNRAMGMIKIRDNVHELLNLQLENTSGGFDSEIADCRKRLNDLYDSFVKKYGNISAPKNAKAFKGDNGYFLLTALENKDEKGKVIGKADIFTVDTLKPKVIAAHVETAEEALILSVSEKGKVDLEFMTELCGMDKNRLISELDGQIYKLPQETEKYVTADEYLSGNIRKKMLEIANSDDPKEYEKNYDALQAAMPPKVQAKDISVKLGSHWVDPKYIRQFILEKLNPDARTERDLEASYSKAAGVWKIEGQTAAAKTNYTAVNTFGTRRKNAYDIIEGILNNSDLVVKDRLKDEYGVEMRDKSGKYILVTNEEETKAVRHCANIIKSEFADWIFKDPDRREVLVEKYNEIYNSFRYREYDGSHLSFVGMNTEITLKEHQKNAIARGLYGGNTLLAHAVGAGKTFEMIAIAMEGKRLGLHNKSLFAVPNSLTEQIGSDFRRLYPNANILVATKKDFEKNNRATLLAKMAANDWDAIIVGHSQFDRMGLSPERETFYLTAEVEKLREELEKIRAENPEAKKSFTVKNIEKSIENYTKRLNDLSEKQVKDDFIDFEQLGVDKIFVDECHMYKNLATATKMRNVAGLGSRGSARAFNLLMKAKYLDEATGGKGTIFASGTPKATP